MRRQAETLAYRWFYVQQNLQVKENVAKVQELLKRAKAANYNGMVLADFKLSILDRVPDFYFPNLAAVKKTADELGIGIFPTVCSCGYDNGLLAHDPNLAAGLPVRDAVFVVKNGEASVVSDNLLPLLCLPSPPALQAISPARSARSSLRCRPSSPFARKLAGRGIDKVFLLRPSSQRGTSGQGKRVAVSAAGRWAEGAGRWRGEMARSGGEMGRRR